MLPSLPDLQEIQTRLELIFPDGTPNRNYVVRSLAARTVFVMLYIGAVEGADRWIRPDQVTRMTDEQAARRDSADREAWAIDSMRPTREAIPGRWYAQNTREPIRDETIRNGFIEFGAMLERQGLPTTSSKPRYALQAAFATLFEPALVGSQLENSITEWRASNLSASALARTRLVKRAVVEGSDRVLVAFPNGETRRMSPGPSSAISKSVVEVFAQRFLQNPGIIWLSESGNKVVQRDEDLAQTLGLVFPPDRLLPDIVLVDLGPPDPLLVFVEVVATDGPVDEKRKAELLTIVYGGGFTENQCAFVSAYSDRGDSAFQRTFRNLAWNSFAWSASEPNSVIFLRQATDEDQRFLYQILQI